MGDHVSGKGLKRADLARRTGCNLETIRYYEKDRHHAGAAAHRVPLSRL